MSKEDKTQGKKGKEKPDKAPKRHVSPVISFFTNQRTRLALGVILCVLAIALLISTISYLKNGSVDQSLVQGRTITEVASASAQIENVGGPTGAFVTNMLFADGIGLGALVTVFYLAVLGLSLFGFMRCRFWAFTFKCLFTAISISIVLGLLTYNAETVTCWGGQHGHYINQWLMNVSGTLGAICVSVILLGLLAVMYLTQLISFYNIVSGKLARRRQAMTDAAAEARKPVVALADVPEQSDVKEEPKQAEAVEKSEEAPAEKAEEPQKEPQQIGFSIDEMDSPQASQPAEDPAKPGEPEFTIHTTAIEGVDNPDESKPINLEPYNVRDELSHYRFPGLDLLIDRPVTSLTTEQEQEDNKRLITKTLADYNIAIARIDATVGPTVTLYEIVPADGVRIAQIRRLEDDIARSLEALGIRIIAPIRGRGTVGIEVPNRNPQTVSMYSIINSRKFRECKFELPMALGATISNEVFIADLTKMPHLLVAGATGQGKSVGLNCIITSLLYKKHPGELKFVLIDPKMVEFSLYARIEKHYLAKLPEEEEPVVTDPNKALATLSALCVEMDNRYDLLKAAQVRNISEYNDKFSRRVLNPQKGHKYMPYIVIVVDEFADLIMVAGKDISTHIARIAQKARAVGMHMIIATQRPSTDVITGMIKANFPARIAFRVASSVDSKTILDTTGANHLIGRGDMLFSHNSMMERVQCAFIDTPEVEALADFISRQTSYPEAYILPEPENAKNDMPGAVDLSRRDEQFDDCARFVATSTTTSTSMLQRRFGIGYNKAARIMEQLEAAGIVGPADGQKPRQVLVDSIGIENILASL